jgi:hypothetical protein
MTDAASLEQAVGEAIAAAVGSHESGFVTKWVAILETVGPDGDRGVWTCTSEDMRAYDSLGLLQYAVLKEEAALLRGDEDDE